MNLFIESYECFHKLIDSSKRMIAVHLEHCNNGYTKLVSESLGECFHCVHGVKHGGRMLITDRKHGRVSDTLPPKNTRAKDVQLLVFAHESLVHSVLCCLFTELRSPAMSLQAFFLFVFFYIYI